MEGFVSEGAGQPLSSEIPSGFPGLGEGKDGGAVPAHAPSSCSSDLGIDFEKMSKCLQIQVADSQGPELWARGPGPSPQEPSLPALPVPREGLVPRWLEDTVMRKGHPGSHSTMELASKLSSSERRK